MSSMNRMGNEGQQDRTEEAGGHTGGGAGDVKKQVQETAAHLKEQAREAVSGMASKASEAVSRVGEKLSTLTGSLREQMSEGGAALHSAAGAFTSRFEEGRDYLREHDLSDIRSEAVSLVRRHPVPAMLAVFGLGLLLGSALRR